MQDGAVCPAFDRPGGVPAIAGPPFLAGAGGILAGFALIFIGIDTLQQGMQVLAGRVNLAELPAHGLVAHFTVVLMGILLTVIMQSSSAAIATTLTALSVHAINFEQASSLVIGAAIGTTVTGALAAIGAGVPARRTALAHILFNLTTGIIALLLLPLFLAGLEQIRLVWGWKDETISLAAFHTGFIALGVILFLPLVNRFSRMIETLVPDTGPSLTRHLDRTLQATPAVALEATRMALRETLLEMIRCLSTGLMLGRWSPQREDIEAAIRQIQEFLDRLHAHPDDLVLTRSRWEQVHAVDHLWRLSTRLKPGLSVRPFLAQDRIGKPAEACQELLRLADACLCGTADSGWPARMQSLSQEIAIIRAEERKRIIEETARGMLGPAEALHLLDAHRWLDRVGHHVWRACVYLSEGQLRQEEAGTQNTPSNPEPTESALQNARVSRK
ncbi:MAG: Na/Pi symporter [Planctomycetaceae bacterium]